jgi:hypothetical protein
LVAVCYSGSVDSDYDVAAFDSRVRGARGDLEMARPFDTDSARKVEAENVM